MPSVSIEQRGPDTWRITISAGFDTRGNRRRIRQTVKGTRTDAEKAELRLAVEVGDNLPAEFSLLTTVTDLLNAWLPAAKLAESTRYDYRLVINKFIADSDLARRRLHKIDTYTIDRFYMSLAADGVGPDRIRRCHTVLRSAFKQAVRWGWVARNPVIDATQPDVPMRDIQRLEPSQFRQVLSAANESFLLAAVAIHLAGTVGSRRGEICGLQWRDFDLEAGTVKVVRSVGVIPGVGDIVKPLKAAPKRREEPKPLDTDTVALLRFWRVVTADQQDESVNPHGWVFLAPAKRSFYRPDRMSRHFQQIAAEAGVPGAHLHQLRHYVITRLIADGVEIDAISRRVGHARTATTLEYGLGVPESARVAADAIARINRGD